MAKGKSKVRIVFFSLIFIAGAVLLMYPVLSNMINKKNQSVVISNYEEALKNISAEEKQQKLAAARAYNQQLADSNLLVQDPFSEAEAKDSQSFLNVGEILAYIEIPQIEVLLPIYDGMSEDILQVGIGWMEGTSMPVGGDSAHCVLTGHRGLPAAKLFRDLDKLSKGDVFWIKSLDETSYYQVFDKEVIDPAEIEQLQIEEGRDIVTLLTCHPYMINSERLLVHAERVDQPPAEELNRISRESGPVQTNRIVAGMVIGGVLLVVLAAGKRRRKSRENKK